MFLRIFFLIAILLYSNSKQLDIQQAALAFMEVGNERHVVSIDVVINDDDKSCGEMSAKRNRLTILVGCNNVYPSRFSLHKNQSNTIETVMRRGHGFQNLGQKYYIHRKNRKQKKLADGGITQRKYLNGVTTSLGRGREASKSYRINTIDCIEQTEKKHDNKNRESAIMDYTRKEKNNIGSCKNKIKNKSLISQHDFGEFNKMIKTKKEKEVEVAPINIKHRKFNKVRTELQEDNFHGRLAEAQVNKKTHDLVSSQKKIAECALKKLQFKRNRGKSIISSHSQRDTLQMRIERNEASMKQKDIKKVQQIQKVDSDVDKREEKPNQKSQANFNNYVEFIQRQKKQTVREKTKRFRPNCQERSLIMKSMLMKQNICRKFPEDATELKQNKKQQKLKIEPNPPKPNPEQKPSKQSSIFQSKASQLQCSTIKQINQSSFLSEAGKIQIIETTAFQVLDTNKPNSLNSYIQVKEESPKKKRGKKQSKMSVICRSEFKQVFPDRFFC